MLEADANDKMANNVFLYSLLADVDDKLHLLWLHLLAKWWAGSERMQSESSGACSVFTVNQTEGTRKEKGFYK